METSTTYQILTYVNIEGAWEPFHHDIPAKTEQGRIGEWLLNNVGPMGNARFPVDGWKWAWSLSTAKLDMPVGVYFVDKEDATAFMLKYAGLARMHGR